MVEEVDVHNKGVEKAKMTEILRVLLGVQDSLHTCREEAEDIHEPAGAQSADTESAEEEHFPLLLLPLLQVIQSKHKEAAGTSHKEEERTLQEDSLPEDDRDTCDAEEAEHTSSDQHCDEDEEESGRRKDREDLLGL